MDAIMKIAEEQPLVLAAVAVVVVVIVSSVFLKKSPPAEKELSSEDIAELSSFGSNTNKSKSLKTKKGKKNKKGGKDSGASKSVAKQAAVPKPAPVVVEEKKEAVSEEAPVEEPTKKKKKKKKKNKSGAAASSSTNGKKESNPAVAADDDDSDEEDEISRLLTKKALAKATGKINRLGGIVPLENGSKNKPSSKVVATSPAAISNPPTLAKEDWVSVNKVHAPGHSLTAEAVPLVPLAAGEDAGGATHSISLDLTLDDPPLIIGPKGVTIQAIQESSGAHLDVSKTASAASVKITGTESAIANAMEQVQTLVSTAAEEKRRATAFSVTLKGEKINFSDGVKAIIGRKGSTIQEIQSKTSTSINADVEKAQVVITGPVEADVEEAAKLCKHAVFGESQHIIELKTRGMVLVVYGKDFAKIREMQNDSGAKLDIEKGTTTLKMSGSIEAVRTAREMVESWMELCKGQTIQIEANKVGAVYGKGGTTIRRIQDRTGAFVEVDDKGKKGKDQVNCSIMGEPDAVKQAVELFQKAIDGEIELKPGEILETMDLGVGAPAIIGRGGSKIRELEQTHSVKLSVNSDTGICQIVGKKEGVESAKTVIGGICKPLWEEQRLLEEAMILAKNQSEAWSMDKFDAANDEADGW